MPARTCAPVSFPLGTLTNGWFESGRAAGDATGGEPRARRFRLRAVVGLVLGAALAGAWLRAVAVGYDRLAHPPAPVAARTPP